MSPTSSDSEMIFDSEDAEMYYIAEDMKKDLIRPLELPGSKMKTKLIYLVVFRWLPSRPASG